MCDLILLHVYISFLIGCYLSLTSAEEANPNPYSHLNCRDPDFGGGHRNLSERKFMVLSGIGGGIGNYLDFYPSAYYFAALTGRVSSIFPFS